MAKKKKVSKKQKVAQRRKVITTLFAILVIAIIAAIFFMYYPTINSDYKNVDSAISKTDEILIDKVVTSNIDLMTLVDGNNTIISWESSDPSVISSTGEVFRPSFLEGDKIVKLTATYKIPLKDKIAEVLSSALGYTEKTKTYTVKVKTLDATNEEKVELALNSISFPEEIYTDINLPSKFSVFNDVNLSWESSNDNVFSSTGEFTRPSSDTTFTITLKASCGDYSSEVSFDATCKSTSATFEEVSIDFNDMSLTSKYADFTYDNIKFSSARIEGEESSSTDSSETGDYGLRHLTLRTNSDASGKIETYFIENANHISFKYTSTRTSGVKESKLVVEFLLANGDSRIREEVLLFDGESHEVNIGITNPSSIKIELVTEYSEEKVYIDDLVITRDLTEEDYTSSLLKQIPSSISSYIVLPYTTKYGGNVTYTSSNESILSNDGVVLASPENNTKVLLTATINVGDNTYTSIIELTIKGSKEAVPVEIHFIDIGKYGQSDCGESIYIKYENIDILIDAADNFDASKQAVTEAITKYLSDGVLDYVIATHPDSDHIGGMPNVFEKFQVENLIVFDGDHTSQKYKNFVSSYTNENCKVINIYDDIMAKNDTILTLGEDVYIEFIDTKYYDENVSEETNGRSIVFLLQAYDTKVLFTGDADSQGAHPDLEENYQSVLGDIDILKVVHHGTREGTSDDYLKAIDPEVAIICNGNYLGNKHSHPHVETITNLYEYDENMKVYCITGGSGSDGCELGSNGSYKCDSSQYMNDRNGTIDLVINNTGYVITSEYYEASPMEVKDTDWWKGYLEVAN